MLINAVLQDTAGVWFTQTPDMQEQGKFGCFTSKYVIKDMAGTGGDIHEEASV